MGLESRSLLFAPPTLWRRLRLPVSARCQALFWHVVASTATDGHEGGGGYGRYLVSTATWHNTLPDSVFGLPEGMNMKMQMAGWLGESRGA